MEELKLREVFRLTHAAAAAAAVVPPGTRIFYWLYTTLKQNVFRFSVKCCIEITCM
jgi:hypothetical protein